MKVRVDSVRYDGGTLAICCGVEVLEDGALTGDRITFGADWRCARDIADTVQRASDLRDCAELPVACVEGWQVVG